VPDVIVVGAGIVGTAIAFEAVKVGARVTLVDRGPIAAQGASRFGFGALSWSAAASPTTAAFSRRGFARYLSMETELGVPIGFRATVGLTLLKDEASVQEAVGQVEAFHAQGHQATFLDQATVRRHEPALRCDDWQGAVALEQGHLDLVQCARAWVERSDPTRLQVRTGVTVQALQGDGSRLETSVGPLEADLVILAVGVWARPLLRTAGVELPVFYSQAEFLYSTPAPPLLGHEVSWGAAVREAAETAAIQGEHRAAWRDNRDEEEVPYTLEHSLVQFEDGHVRIGQLSRFIPAYRSEPTAASREVLLASARGLLPRVDELPQLRLGARQVTFSPDHLPIVGPLPGMPRAILVATSTSPTILVPALAEALAAFATAGTWDDALDEWRLDRPGIREYCETLPEQQVPSAS
jgi:glycine/D-amino acid oxidase-like deaminating enzyme